MSPELQTFILAMTPIGELRIALPIALTVYNLSVVNAFLISVVGNLVPVMFILLLGGPVSGWLSKRSRLFNILFTWLFERTRKKYSLQVTKYGAPALVAFVGIPLPFTGAWTGSIAAFLFGVPFKKAFPLVFLGIVIAGLIVAPLSVLGITVEEYFGWQAIIGILLTIIFIAVIYNIINKRKNI